MTILDGLNAFTGGASLLVAAVGLWYQVRKVNTVRALRDGLRAINHSRVKSILDEDEVLVEYLNYAILIAGPLKSRLTRRFLLAAFAIIACYIHIPADDPSAVVATVPAFDWSDLILFGVQIAAGVLAPMTVGLSQDEKKFLENAAALNERFYEIFVIPAMREFNDAI